MKVAIYLSAVPGKSKNKFKRDLLIQFANGVSACGDHVQIVDDVGLIADCDLAVIQGWIGMKTAPHLEQRRRVIKEQRKTGKHTLVIDSNLFGFLEPNDFNRYLRYSLDGIFPNTGYYFSKNIDASRWQEIKQSYNFIEKDWNANGQYVLVCLQRDGGWSMDGIGVVEWLDDILPKIQSSTNRKVLVRPHPGSMQVVDDIKQKFPNVEISSEKDIRDDFARAWCTVTYNSSPGVASLLWGVPVFVTDPMPMRSQAYGFASTDLKSVDSPIRPDRTEFYHKIAQCHFSTAGLATGQSWKFMKDRLL